MTEDIGLDTSPLLINEPPMQVLPSLAVAIGLSEAIVLQQIHYWTRINDAANKNYQEGYYWTYNSFVKWQEQFPFWSLRTVKTIFKRLFDKKLLVSGNFNKASFDHTSWYRINYEALHQIQISTIGDITFEQNSPTDSANLAPSISPDLHRQYQRLTPQRLSPLSIKEKPKLILPEWIIKETWDAFIGMRIKIKAPLTEYAKRLAINKLQAFREDGEDPNAILDKAIMNTWKGLFSLKEKYSAEKKGAYGANQKVSDPPGGRQLSNDELRESYERFQA